jgi:hypothetical protein
VSRRFQQASRLLHSSGRVAELLDTIESNRLLLRKVRERLPAPLDDRCLHAALEEGVLTLVTDSAVWGSRLRFFAPELIKALGNGLGRIESTRVRIQPGASPHRRDHCGTRPLKMSRETVKLLTDTAEGLGDTQLSRALRRLAETGAAHG